MSIFDLVPDHHKRTIRYSATIIAIVAALLIGAFASPYIPASPSPDPRPVVNADSSAADSATPVLPIHDGYTGGPMVPLRAGAMFAIQDHAKYQYKILLNGVMKGAVREVTIWRIRDIVNPNHPMGRERLYDRVAQLSVPVPQTTESGLWSPSIVNWGVPRFRSDPCGECVPAFKLRPFDPTCPDCDDIDDEIFADGDRVFIEYPADECILFWPPKKGEPLVLPVVSQIDRVSRDPTTIPAVRAGIPVDAGSSRP